MKFINAFFVSIILLVSFSCEKNEDLVDFTKEEEVLLGEKLTDLISNSGEYSIVPREGNSVTYGYVDSRLNEIISSPFLNNTEFNWTITMMDDESRGAFIAPGGYIFINTGLIFFLENEDQFSGLIAHMIAHIDSSHVTKQLLFEFGVNGLKSIANGNDEDRLLEVAKFLDLSGTTVQYSRADENEAEMQAIQLLSNAPQSCLSSGLFGERMFTVQSDQQSAFLDAHRITESRIEELSEFINEFGCNTSVSDPDGDTFINFRNMLP